MSDNGPTTGSAPGHRAPGPPVPAIEGWFTLDDEPALVGTRCRACGTVFFPRETEFCRNPRCAGTDLDEVRLSRRGRVWSYTDARYQPPAPYIPCTDPYEPFALAAVELEAEGIVVLGQVADGYGVDDLQVGAPVELVIEPLYVDGGVERVTWRWRPLRGGAAGTAGAAAASETGAGR
jgi:uncharacterized protein